MTSSLTILLTGSKKRGQVKTSPRTS